MAQQDDDKYFWLWYGDHGASWTPYDAACMEQLEAARKADKEKVKLKNTNFEINLLSMEQKNVNTRYTRPVTMTEARWYWLDDDGRSWRCYKEEDALKLAIGQLTLEELGAGARSFIVALQIGGATYEVDLAKKKQRNVISGLERNVHRGVPSSLRTLHRSIKDDNAVSAAQRVALISGTGSGKHRPIQVTGNGSGKHKPIQVTGNSSGQHRPIQANNNRLLTPNSSGQHRPIQVNNNSQPTGQNNNAAQSQPRNEEKDSPPTASLCACITKLFLGPDNQEEDDLQRRPSLVTSEGRPSRPAMPPPCLEEVQQKNNDTITPMVHPPGIIVQPLVPQPPDTASTSSEEEKRDEDSPHVVDNDDAPKEEAPRSKGFSEDYTRSQTLHDTLKIVCLGLTNFGKMGFCNPTTKDGQLGVNQYNWGLQRTDTTDDNSKKQSLFCHVFDFVGQNVHHGTAKLFFSPMSVYVIVWDLGTSNKATFPRQQHTLTFGTEPSKIALERDIFEKVQFWVDAIHQYAPDAVILPVASIDGSFATNADASQVQPPPDANINNINNNQSTMDEKEIQRRCIFLKEYFQDEQRKTQYEDVIFGPDDDPVLRVGGSTKEAESERLNGLKLRLLQLSSDSKLFPSLGQDVPPRYIQVRTAVNRVSQDGTNVVDASQFTRSEATADVKEEVSTALQWLSNIGELLYYGASGNHDLDGYVVLNSKWLLHIMTPLLQCPGGDLQTLIEKARRDASDDSVSNDETEGLYHGPVASFNDLCLLWRSSLEDDMDVDDPDIGPLLNYLRRLFTHVSIMIPLELGDEHTPSDIFFFPGLLGSGNYEEFVQFYRNVILSGTILAQSIQFHTKVSSLLLEQSWASILSNVYSNAKIGPENERSEGKLYVKEIVCYQFLLHFKFRLYARTSDEIIEPSEVEVYAHFLDASSPECLYVGANYMAEIKQKLVIGAKGEGGNGGKVIWGGGYELVSDSVLRFLGDSISELDLERHFYCPSCLGKSDLRKARYWNTNKIEEALEGGEEEFICASGHKEKIPLLLGQSTATTSDVAEIRLPSSLPANARASALMPGVVMVGLYDPKRTTEKIRKVGSGFIVDKERGLIVTAAHTLMILDDKKDFGRDFDGIEDAKAVIGVIPARSSGGSYPPAIFRYFAKIYRKDPSLSKLECHLDACVLKITGRFEHDVSGNGDLCSEESIEDLECEPSLMRGQPLKQLEVVETAHVGEPVRIFGFDQPDNTRLNRSIEISPGHIQKQVSTEGFEGKRYQYTPRKSIVLKCPTIVGHSGGPCVNQKGEVIGILSYADKHEKSLCYLAPTSEWIHLMRPPGVDKW